MSTHSTGRTRNLVLAIAVIGTTAALTLGAAVLPVLRAILYAPPAEVAEPESLLQVVRLDADAKRLPFTRREALAIVDGAHPLWRGVAWAKAAGLARIGNAAKEIRLLEVTSDYFAVIAPKIPVGGRLRDLQGDPKVVLVSHHFYATTLEPLGIVRGDVLAIDDELRTIVGVAPSGFSGPLREPVDAWIPLREPSRVSPQSEIFIQRAQFSAVVRLRTADALPTARAAIETIVGRNSTSLSGAFARSGKIELIPLGDPRLLPRKVGQLSRWISLTCATLALAACINLSSLVLVDSLRLRGSSAVRIALGASPARAMRPVAVRYVGWGAIGVLTGIAGVLALRQPLTELFGDGAQQQPALLFTIFGAAAALGLVLLASWFFWLFSLRRLHRQLANVLREQAAAPRLHSRFVLLSCQIVLCAAAAVIAVRFRSAVRDMQQAQLRFSPDDLWSAPIIESNPERMSLADRWRDSIMRAPGVMEIAFGTMLPTQGTMSMRVLLPGQTEETSLYVNAVDEQYFNVAGMRLLHGRNFGSMDTRDASFVAVINRTFARQLVRAGQPIGSQCFGSAQDPCGIAVIGIVEDSKYLDLHEEPRPFAYTPLIQRAVGAPIVALVRVSPSFDRREFTTPGWRRLLDRGATYRSFAEMFRSELRPWTTGVRLFSITAAVGLVVAITGMASLAASVVQTRGREIAIRLALGGTPGDIGSMVVRDAARWWLPALAAGITVGYLATGSLTDSTSRDTPMLTLGVGALLSLVLITAALLPALRYASQADHLKQLNSA